ncbi:MAG TPA: hypothetical protein VMR00_17025 [Streptosporangiaceae bacterium]|jgi:hypothetical protein|nr:hypothetical protein [Streptosporangiaceae bacterium]
MIVIVGLVILVAAVVAGVAGVLTNSGHAHAAGHFAVFGYHVTGSTGTLFLYGIVVGAIALLGLSLLLAGARRTARRGRDARRGLKQSRRETAAVTQDRDDLAGQRDTARAYTASNLGDDGAARNGSRPGVFARLFSRPATQAPPARGQEPAAVPAAVPQSAPLAVPAVPADGIGPADAGIPASASAPAE